MEMELGALRNTFMIGTAPSGSPFISDRLIFSQRVNTAQFQ